MSTISASAEGSGPGRLARTISSNVRGLMGQRKVSQAALAQAIGLPQSGISARLNGSTNWSADDIEAVCLAFDVPWERLIQPVEEEKEPAPLRVVAHSGRSRRVTQHTHKYVTSAGLVTAGYRRRFQPPACRAA
jgi:transcriptional regulator with XRE-family HTH domain